MGNAILWKNAADPSYTGQFSMEESWFPIKDPDFLLKNVDFITKTAIADLAPPALASKCCVLKSKKRFFSTK